MQRFASLIFLRKHENKKIVVLDIPLLLENKINTKKDILVFVESKKVEVLKKLRETKLYQDDLRKIDFLYESIDYSKPLSNLDKLNTQKAMIHFKFRLLSDKKLNIRFKILLYFDLKDSEKEYLNDEYCKTLEKIKSKFTSISLTASAPIPAVKASSPNSS